MQSRNFKTKEMADKPLMDDDETTACQLTVAFLKYTLKKPFSQAEKNSKERFEHIESQLRTIQETYPNMVKISRLSAQSPQHYRYGSRMLKKPHCNTAKH